MSSDGVQWSIYNKTHDMFRSGVKLWQFCMTWVPGGSPGVALDLICFVVLLFMCIYTEYKYNISFI